MRRATGDALRRVSAAFFLVPAFGERRIATAASLREVLALRVVALLSAAVFVDFRAVAFGAVERAAPVERAVRAVVAGLAVRVVRVAVLRVAVLRPVAAVRAAGAARLAAGAFATRIEARVVALAAVVRLRPAAEALDLTAALRAGALRAALARVVAVPRAGALLARLVTLLAVRAVELLVVARAGALLALVLRVAADLLARFFAAAEREAGLLAVRIVRAVVLRPVAELVRRPPERTAMARVRRPGVLLSFSLLMV